MPNPTKIIYDCATHTESIVELTDAEVADLAAQNAVIAQEKANAEAAQLALEALKVSAKAKLVAGQPLTEEEANTLVL